MTITTTITSITTTTTTTATATAIIATIFSSYTLNSFTYKMEVDKVINTRKEKFVIFWLIPVHFG
jgi:putative flippase GtrA